MLNCYLNLKIIDDSSSIVKNNTKIIDCEKYTINISKVSDLLSTNILYGSLLKHIKVLLN